MLDVSVVVCHHVGDFLPGFVSSIKKSVGVTYEVLIITSDEKLATEGYPGCYTFYSKELPAAKRNIGVKLSKGKYIAFFDDDTEIDENCLLEFKNYLDTHENVGMVYGKLWNAERRNRFDEAGGYLTSTGFIWSRAGQNDIDNGQYDIAEPILAGKSASCMIRKNTFIHVGGFDEEFGILGEETDLSWRVWLHGQEVHYVPKATGIHWFNTKRKDSGKYYTNSRVFKNGCRNYIVMLIKNLETGSLWAILPKHMTIWFFAGLVMLITGKAIKGVNILNGLFSVPRHLGSILKKRQRIQQNRIKSDRDIWPFIFRRTSWAYYRTRICRYLTLGLHG